ncbi:MAG: outer membrane beta-barrel protein [Prolixibacteraceae bacterium]|nr:outer membrane beta-barrel protein [Prolixibacteraceae bacterium]
MVEVLQNVFILYFLNGKKKLTVKLSITIFLLLLSVFGLMAQSPFGVSKQPFTEQTCFFELNGSAILPKVGFNGTGFDNAVSDHIFRKAFGMAIRWQYERNWSVAGNVTYRETGAYFPHNNNYRLKSNDINVYIPVEFDIYIKAKPRVKPPQFVLFAGPYVSYNIGGEMVADMLQQDLNEHNISPFDAGIEAGVGMRIPTFSFSHRSFINIKASYFYGLLNTFPNERVANEQLMLSSAGKRFNYGVRITLAYEMSVLKKEFNKFTAGGDGKRTYERILVK